MTGRRPDPGASRPDPGETQGPDTTDSNSASARSGAGDHPDRPVPGTEDSGDPTAPGFDANALALDPGLRLLEASAGTGKTFALAHLVLRLVSESGLRLGEILVVTFTEAAAAELRDRIGRRLQQALVALEGVDSSAYAAPPPADGVLQGWLQRCLALPAAERPRLRIRLLLALEELAAADITTIHGFCRRTLVREALTAGRTPQLQLEDPGDPGIEEVVHAYWSRQVLSLPAHLLAGLRRGGLKPEQLEDLLRSLDGDPALRLDPLPAGVDAQASLAEALPLLWHDRWQRFVSLWQQDGRALQEALHEEARRWKEQGAGKTDPYLPSSRKDRCAELDGWIAQQPEGGDYDACLDQKLLSGYYHPGPFSRVARRAEQRPALNVRLPLPELMQSVAELLEGPAETMALHALHHCRARLQERRRRRGVSTFSQLLVDLDPGPDPLIPSPLMEAVAGRYKAALIDEFQDTDPIQWRILRRAFGQGRHLLVMVGDPKQAIYRFRGGDLATYLAAASLADERHNLNENRRSSKALIGALNCLMAPGLRRSGLPVPPVEPRASRSGPSGLPIELLWLSADEADPVDAPDPTAADSTTATGAHRHPSRTELERRQPELVARHLLDLLQRNLLLGEGERQRPLAADDICLLVSNHRQAEAIRAALERHGIASRLVSRADVFTSPAATCLQRLLDALADPSDTNRLRLLAASPLLGWSGQRIAACPPQDWAELAGRLSGLAQRLPRRGLLGALTDLLGADGLARLNLAGRLAADLQQVSELVQRRLHAEQLTPAAAADWLRRLRLDPERQVPEAHQAHSDRADGTVSVITIHRSKGLEFPVVFCPFLWQASSSAGAQALSRRWQPPDGGDPVLDLHRNVHWGVGFEAERQRLQAEESERERLAYVALTRAQHLLVLAWGPARGQQCAPLLPWLFAAQPVAEPEEDPIADAAEATWRERLEAEIAQRHLPIRLVDGASLPAAAPPPPANGDTAALETGPVPRRSLDRSWGRSSYSGWIHGASPQSEPSLAPEALEEGRDTGDATPPELLEPLPVLLEEGRDTGDGRLRDQKMPLPVPLGEGRDTGAGSLRDQKMPLPVPLEASAGAAEGPVEGMGGADFGSSDAAAGSAGLPSAWVTAASPPSGPMASPLSPGNNDNSASREGPSPVLGREPSTPDAAADATPQIQGPLALFPSGAVAGDCLHRILEQLDYSRPFCEEDCGAVVDRELQRSGLELSLRPMVLAGLEQVRTSPFGGPLGPLRLADLRAGRWLNELRFDLSLGFAEARALAAAFRDAPGGAFGADYGARLARLPIASRGFLTGAIDLVFPVAGADGEERWWVLDWKSNWLGRRDGEGRPIACGPADYHREAMVSLMAASHYPLQAHLYLVALHRYLRWRLKSYDPARHLGGYAYVFLRGVPGPVACAAADPAGQVPGMMVEGPPLARLLALDAALGRTVADGWDRNPEAP